MKKDKKSADAQNKNKDVQDIDPTVPSLDGQDQPQPVPDQSEWQAKYIELNDKYLRLYSDFDNFRKRSLKERIDLSRSASEEVIKELLPVMDDFDRAIATNASADSADAIIKGIELVYAKLRNLLNMKGLKEMDTIGKPFDTDFHEAITSIPATADEQRNTVVDEIQKGYLLNDKVIRFAKVVTAI